jgi:hypothetical protein
LPNTLLQAQIEKARKPFTGQFKEAREDWLALIDREVAPDVEDHLKKLAEGFDYRTPDLKKQVRDWISINKTDTTYLDVISTDPSAETRKKLRNVLHWLGRGWEYENEGRVWDRICIESQATTGVMVARLCWHPQLDPKIDRDLEPDAYMKKRNELLKKRKHPFYWTYPSIFGCGWLGDDDNEYGPDFFVYESEVPYLEAVGKYRKDGQKLGYLDGKTCWIGRDDAVDETWHTKTVKVTIIDARDLDGGECPCAEYGCDHPVRKICVYICDNGSYASEDDLYEEYPSPFPGCSFFIVGGDIRNSRDPHKRFMPVMYESFTEAEWTNGLTTRLAAQMSEDYGPNRYYLDYSQTARELLTGEDGQIKLDFPYNASAEGTIHGLPGELKRPPSSISPHMISLINLHRERLERFSINRFLTGDTAHEASNATGTAFLQTTEQAGVLPSMLLGESDRAQLRRAKYVIHATKYWGTFDPPGVVTPYTLVHTGNDSYLKYRNATPQAGEVAEVSAQLFYDLDFDIVITSKSETLQEQGARYLQAKDKRAEGLWTLEQELRDSGVDDVEGQLELLDLQQIRQNFAPQQAMLDNLEIVRIFESATGISLGGALGGVPPPQQPQNGNVAPTAVMGSPGTAIGIPGNNLIGRTINQPRGGSSPTRGPGQA